MRMVPYRLLSRVKGGIWAGQRKWTRLPGIVYLMRCRVTGEYKFGATVNPAARLPQLVWQSRKKRNRHLEYVWGVVTNGVGVLERYWANRWRGYRVSGYREWVNLPDDEVRAFRAVSSVILKKLPRPNREWLECVSGPYIPPKPAKPVRKPRTGRKP